MKQFLSQISIILSLLVAFASCTSEKPAEKVFLEVTENNLAGKWELVKLNGSALQPGSYVHIEFIRKGSEFIITQNVDSFENGTHESTGRFNIVFEDGYGYVLYGTYNHEEGLWAHAYIVSELTSDSFKMIAKDDPAYVQEFSRLN